ncbi:MAG: hypothetical protein KKC55_17495 [Gammaproteobacteria bacterium]|uniref:Uncharacterized protein n=1 Tax=viral metagenome TaxID=1070528 RepID=A0A6M3LWV5_9ZZZZ|nr:hypothetical protein [Gammaproteobacteria bacterium]
MENQLLKEIAQDIGETKGMVSAMRDDFEKIDRTLNRHDKRLRRIENLFIPAVAVLGLIGQKIMKLIGL